MPFGRMVRSPCNHPLYGILNGGVLIATTQSAMVGSSLFWMVPAWLALGHVPKAGLYWMRIC